MSASAVRKQKASPFPLLVPEPQDANVGMGSGSTFLGCGSLLAASLETICTAFVALSKLGILTAFTSFLGTIIVSRYHADRIRVPVLALAFLGATLNLLVLWNRQRLRNRPSAAWRIRPLRVRERWRTRVLVAVSVVTMFLIAAEFLIHPIRGF
jgi:hypothetical protein